MSHFRSCVDSDFLSTAICLCLCPLGESCMLETDLSAEWSGVIRSKPACDMEKKCIFRVSPVVVRVSLDDPFCYAVLTE